MEIKAIREKLSEMHSDIKKVMEYSNRLRFETALESSRQECSHALLNHLFEDIETGLERKHGRRRCPEKSEDLEMVEIKAIREKLSEMHSDIKKVMEYSKPATFQNCS